ncbi:LacI family transcriptional regulator [Kosmotoga arenicorallina S304]|uniref:LacI family transcriptional regulator n=1 Tax=Kosmotoga arenicorallina S304 TaxID=1453497 RepID=A0A176JUU3_9BACT|nr:LacI family DNA-binding transcriptional regulator [Kosmotoga arenicorallina]OAA27220.1 LacI family transcriptional regulator [Kosmotoga arenicorallina S304]
MQKHPGIKDIARIAGVSIATVSRVLNGNSYVSPELSKRVLEAAGKLKYQPNRIARGLRKGKTNTIGFLIPDIENPFFSAIVKGAEDFLRKFGYTILLCSSSGIAEREDELLNVLFSHKVDGLMTIPLESQTPYLEKIERLGIPVVVIDDIIKKKDVSSVASDNYSGMSQLMRYLLDTNHKSFAFLSGDPHTYSGKERLRAFRDVMVRQQENVEYEILFGTYTFNSGIDMLRKLKRIPDAIVCGNDMIAFGVLTELQRMRYKIPDDVSITGFDDVLFSKMTNPPLTTVRQDYYMMGEVAAQLLMDSLNYKKRDSVLLKTELVIRGSSRE